MSRETATNPICDKCHNATNVISDKHNMTSNIMTDKHYKATNVITDKPHKVDKRHLGVSLMTFVAAPPKVKDEDRCQGKMP